MGAVAVAIGLVLGGLAFAYWQSRSHADTVEATAPVVTAAAPPASRRLWMPSTSAELEQLLDTARTWVRMTPDADDSELARVVWAFHWQGERFPSRLELAASPTAAEAVELVDRVVATARVEEFDAEAEATTEVPSPSDEPEALPDDNEKSVRETPTPGHFYEVRSEDTLLGDDGVAARALYGAVIDAARHKGWSRDKAEHRATNIASKAKMQAGYAELIRRSDRNRGQPSELVAGELLWLPPIHAARLLDRTRRRQLVLDSSPHSHESRWSLTPACTDHAFRSPTVEDSRASVSSLDVPIETSSDA